MPKAAKLNQHISSVVSFLSHRQTPTNLELSRYLFIPLCGHLEEGQMFLHREQAPAIEPGLCGDTSVTICGEQKEAKATPLTRKERTKSEKRDALMHPKQWFGTSAKSAEWPVPYASTPRFSQGREVLRGKKKAKRERMKESP
jgi:hypothetical protein